MKNSRLLTLDIIAAVLYIIAANPIITGLSVHEWVSLGVLLVFIVHGAQHYDWVIEAFRKLRSKPNLLQTANLVLGTLLVAVFMVVTVSGIMVSRHILPLLGLVAPDYFFWNPLHSVSAKALLALALIHVVVHAGWLWRHIKGWSQGRSRAGSPKMTGDDV
ncbi:MAG: DUF4405 domain-containing protein [Coriobacteriia bacterium]|nr:DUF4405 domain-containing protein [Coriobacteriia bacterium]